LLRRTDIVKRMRHLNAKNPKLYNDQDWNKFISIFAVYLNYVSLGSKKFFASLNEQEIMEVKIAIVNDFLVYNLG
jgi:hypothetical protein